MDTDNDGVPNNFDRDSDGDGCPDVYESGVPGATKNTGNYTDSVVVDPSSPTTGVGTNGYKNSLETASDSGVPNFTSTYGNYALSATLNTCADRDNDGINDMTDIDDDNDGIPDSIEDGGACGTAARPFTSLEQARANVTEAGVYYFNLGGNKFSTYVDANGYVLVAIDYGDGNGNLPATNTLSFTKAEVPRGILNATTLAALGTIEQLRISSNSESRGGADVTSSNAELISRVKANKTLHGGGTGDDVYNDSWSGFNEGFFKANSTTSGGTVANLPARIISITGAYSSFNWRPELDYQRICWSNGEIGSDEYLALWVRGNNSGTICTGNADADNDGIPNRLELDSDGDGCPDVYEAGVPGATKNTGNYTDSVVVDPSSPTTGVGTNGFKNSLEISTDNGVPNFKDTYNLYALFAGVNRCTDTDKDGIGDIEDIDDDNDGILDSIEDGGLCGTAEKPFTSLEQARASVTEAGIYYFNLSGNKFSTYVDANGYVLVAVDYGDGTGTLPSSNALGLSKSANGRGILNATTLAALGTIEQIRISSSSSDGGGVDATSSNTELIRRLKANQALHSGLAADNSYNESWTGTGQAYLRADASGKGSDENLAQMILITPNGDNTNFYWVPHDNYQEIQHATGEIASNDYFALWVRGNSSGIVCISITDADLDGIPNHLDLDSDGDGCSDALETQIVGELTPAIMQNSSGPAFSPKAIAKGGYGANGFADSLETAVESGMYKASYAGYDAALNSSVSQACPQGPPVRLRDSARTNVVNPSNGVGATTVYPNPSTGVFTVQGVATDLSVITLFNAAAANVTQQAHITRVTGQKIQVNISSLPDGIYYLKTKTKGFKILKR